LTERSIEIPIIKYFLGLYKHENVLEIGNVSNHYYDEFKDMFVHKDTVDKYESGYDVINQDIADYKSDKKYDFIYSISTFEHMDSDGGRNDDYVRLKKKQKPFSSIAFSNIQYCLDNLLGEGGRMVITFPLGYLTDEVGGSLVNAEERFFSAEYIDINYIAWKMKMIVVMVMGK